MHAQPTLLEIPPEIRTIIYSYLLDTGGDHLIEIGSQWPPKLSDRVVRTQYYVEGPSFSRGVAKTTYHRQNSTSPIHPAIVAVNRKLRNEASHYLYSKHAFTFERGAEAVTPFLSDLTPLTKMALKEITIRKFVPGSIRDPTGIVWGSICKSMQSIGQLKKLRIIVEGRKPLVPWTGPQSFAPSDMKLLYSTRHDCLDWVRDLAAVKGVEEIEILTDLKPTGEPDSSHTLVIAALSASLGEPLAEFLEEELGVPVKVGGPVEAGPFGY